MTTVIEVTEGRVSKELSRRDNLPAILKRAAEAAATDRWLGMFSSAGAHPQKAYTTDVKTQVVLSVLAKARHDIAFLAQLSENPSKALEGYDLTPETEAALASRVVHWLDLFGGRRPRLRAAH